MKILVTAAILTSVLTLNGGKYYYYEVVDVPNRPGCYLICMDMVDDGFNVGHLYGSCPNNYFHRSFDDYCTFEHKDIVE